MPTDRLLVTLLRSLQIHSDQQDIRPLLSTAASLLTTLHNHKNLTLLTHQICSAPAIWTRSDGLRTSYQVMAIFQSAAVTILRREDEATKNDASQQSRNTTVDPGALSREKWVKAIINGADDQSPRWRHILVIAGLLIGFEDQGRRGLSRHLRKTVQVALVKAINLVLLDVRTEIDLAAHSLCLALNYCFKLLPENESAQLDYDRLLPVLVGTGFFSNEGYQSGYFFAAADQDVREIANKKFAWSNRSTSFLKLNDLSNRPLFTTMGPFSRLIAHAVEHVSDSWLIQTMMDDIFAFSKTVVVQWRRNKMSKVDRSEESLYFDQASVTNTIPILWKMLRSALFATNIVLTAVIGRVLNDSRLGQDSVSPEIATQTLHILRNLYFISSRLGSGSLSQQTFVYLTSIDILSAHPQHAETFIDEIRPAFLGQISTNPLERVLDLYFLNTAELLTLNLSPSTNDNLLVAAATPYLAAGGNNNLLEIFEAAHSVMLAVLSSPHCAEIAARHLPFYVEALFQVFPQNMTSRQFRLAFKTLVQVSTPPSPLAETHPLLPETLLELLYHRALVNKPRPAPYTAPPRTADSHSTQSPTTFHFTSDSVEERTSLVLTLIDTLAYLPPELLLEWLPLTAGLVQAIDSAARRQTCRERFWEVLSDGEMDVERSRMCVTWWGTRGGREMVLTEPSTETYEMSGALPPPQTLNSKL